MPRRSVGRRRRSGSPTCATAVLAAYRDPPQDRPRELAGFLQTTAGGAGRGCAADQALPRIVALAPVATRMAPARWPVTALHDLRDLARLLTIDQGELAWFADVRGLERAARAAAALPLAGRCQRDGVPVLAAPKPRLKEIQRRLLRHVFAPDPAACGGARRRAGPLGSLRAAAARRFADVVIKADLEAFFTSCRLPGLGCAARWPAFPRRLRTR